MRADSGGHAAPWFPCNPGCVRRGRRQRAVPRGRRKRGASHETRIGCPAGIFVAPGAAGLFLGTLLGRSGFSALWMVALVLGAFSALLLAREAPALQPRDRLPRPFGRGRLIVLLLLSSIAMRSLLTLAVGFPGTASPALAPLVLAAVLGKGLGGVLADRFGWMRTAVCAP